MHIPDHLQKSRHGIWYYRWVIPARSLGTEGRDIDALATLDAVWSDIRQFFGPTAYRWVVLIANARGHVRLNTGNVAGAIEAFRAQMEATDLALGIRIP